MYMFCGINIQCQMRNHTIQMKIYNNNIVTRKGVQQLVRDDLLKNSDIYLLYYFRRELEL